MECPAAAATGRVEINNHQTIAGMEQGVYEVLRRIDLHHVGFEAFIPPPLSSANTAGRLQYQIEQFNLLPLAWNPVARSILNKLKSFPVPVYRRKNAFFWNQMGFIWRKEQKDALFLHERRNLRCTWCSDLRHPSHPRQELVFPWIILQLKREAPSYFVHQSSKSWRSDRAQGPLFFWS